MNSLSLLPDVCQAQPYHFFDPLYQPTKCELVVQPGHGWAVATELLDAKGAGLMNSLTSLAAKICSDYDIEPAQLSLFARYAYEDETTGLYVVQFGHSDRDLFEGIRFLAPTRKELPAQDAGALFEQLAIGAHLGPELRALQPARSIG